jgi:hypothetical protein
LLKGVLAIGLTWRDAVSLGAAVMIVIVYTAFLGGAGLWLISGVWATSAAVLILGVGSAVLAASDLYTRPQPPAGVLFRRIATSLGTIAVIAGVTGLVTGSAHALEILVVVTMALLGTTSFWHVLTIGSEQ